MIARSLERRRQGQGMTEYIILVGLIAILLVAVVTNFKDSIQVTIEGTTNKTEDIADSMPGGGGPLTDPGGSPGGVTRVPVAPHPTIPGAYINSGDPSDTGVYNADGTPRRP